MSELSLTIAVQITSNLDNKLLNIYNQITGDFNLDSIFIFYFLYSTLAKSK
jgi:hypothetical protein